MGKKWLLSFSMFLLLFTVSHNMVVSVCSAEGIEFGNGSGRVLAQDTTGKITPLDDTICNEAYQRDVTYKKKDDVKAGCYTIPAGMKITLTAYPDADSYFGGWSGACTHQRKSCTFTMTKNTYIRWRFNKR